METTSWFWKETIWLPPNMTWSDVTPQEGDGNYTRFSDLAYPIPASLVIVMIRRLVERLCFRPMGEYLGIRSVRPTLAQCPILEEYYRKGQDRHNRAESRRLGQLCGMTERQVDSWLRSRRMQGKPSLMDKFCETGWRLLYYLTAFIYGLVSLWSKPWLWNIRLCWYDYPHHPVDDSVWSYYMFQLSFYWSLSIMQFFDVKRKDFVEMFIHHITTISLMSFSWTCNLTRCGALVLFVHDFADIFLEAAKLFHYAKFTTVCDLTFGFFTLSWVVTRLGLFPSWILFSTAVEAPQLVSMFPAYYIFNGLLSILLILHICWTYFILKMAFFAIYAKDEKMRDTRSDSEDGDGLSDTEPVETHTQQKVFPPIQEEETTSSTVENVVLPEAEQSDTDLEIKDRLQKEGKKKEEEGDQPKNGLVRSVTR